MTDTTNDTAYELLAQELESLSLTPKTDTRAVFRPLNGIPDETYRDALEQKLAIVFGTSNVTVGAATKTGGIDVTIKQGAGVRHKLAEIISRNDGMDF